nr:type IV secretion system DNA-binding domain-containing protein [Agrobacterium tumefaciens]
MSKVARWVLRKTDLAFSKSPNPLLRGDLVAYAEQEYPRDEFPTAWAAIPDDIRRPLIWDGRLLNGRRVAEMAKAAMTDEVVSRALVRSGVHAFGLSMLIGSAILYVAIGASHGFFAIFEGITPFPSWAWDNGAYLPVASWLVLTVIERLMTVLTIAIGSGLIFMAFPLFWFYAFAGAMNSAWSSVSSPLRVATRDSEVFWKSNVLARTLQIKAYEREVEQATTRLAHQPLIPVGAGTGTIRGRGDMEAPTKGQTVAYDGESIRQHTLILGGTGAGKTRLVIRPLFKRIMEANWGEGHKIGAYVTDGKGTLWRDLAPVVAANRDDVAILGTGADHYGLDLVAGMSPLEVSTTFKAIAGQINGESKDSFWPESASLLLMHSATLARALELDEELSQEWVQKRGCRPYSLIGIAILSENAALMNDSFVRFADLAGTVGPNTPTEYKEKLIEADKSITWLSESFLKLGENTKGSILANVSAVLGKLSGAPEITRRFCSGAYERSVDVDHALKGGILFVAVGETEHGMAGKVITTWLKTRLYILARRRLLTDPEGCRLNSCALFADEFQMLATVGPDTDTTFWNIARETGVFMVAATQSLAALQQAIGQDATNNLTNLLRSKIILKTEEVTTINYAKQLAGEVARGWEYEDGFYATQFVRELVIGDRGNLAVNVSGFQGLFPVQFNSSVAQASPYNASHLAEMWQRASNPVGNGSVDSGDGGASQNAQQMAMREEDQNRNTLVGSLQMRGKIDTDELLIGSGHAFAIIQRAGGDRMDIIDLEIAA